MQTIENTREKDETFVHPEDEDVLLDEADDEFAGVGGQSNSSDDVSPGSSCQISNQLLILITCPLRLALGLWGGLAQQSLHSMCTCICVLHPCGSSKNMSGSLFRGVPLDSMRLAQQPLLAMRQLGIDCRLLSAGSTAQGAGDHQLQTLWNHVPPRSRPAGGAPGCHLLQTPGSTPHSMLKFSTQNCSFAALQSFALLYETITPLVAAKKAHQSSPCFALDLPHFVSLCWAW